MALVDLQFIQYNNYFNKILKKPENPFIASSYDSYPEKEYIRNVSFNENDGVTAYHIVNKDIDDIGDYLLVIGEADVVKSHWFITEAKRNRVGQCMVTLQRDLLVDYYHIIKTAPAFIERGMLDNDDPMIFNDEGLSFNQIKTEVTPLMDKTNCAWIVGYLAKESDLSNEDIEVPVSISTADPDYTYSSWADVPQDLQDLISGNKKFYKNVKNINLFINDIGYVPDHNSLAYYIQEIGVREYSGNVQFYKVLDSDFILNSTGAINRNKSTSHSLRYFNFGRPSGDNTSYASAMFNVFNSALKYAIEQNKNNIISTYNIGNTSLENTIEEFKDKIISVGGTKYKIVVEDIDYTLDGDLENKTTLDSALKNSIYYITKDAPHANKLDYVDSNGNHLSNLNVAKFELKIELTNSTVEATQLGQVAQVTFPNHANRQETLDAQYDIFAIPLPLKNFGYDGNTKFATSKLGIHYYTINYEVSLAVAQKLAIEFGSKLYDLQLLPYCPVQLDFNRRIGSSIIPNDETISCRYITVNDVVKSFLLFADKSEFEKDIWVEIEGSGNSKMQKSTMKYRVSGGNYASMFDFTPDMCKGINGGVDQFKAYCNYKPYKPFIKVNPYFGYLYGNESFRDANGMILSGDTSLTILSDAWTNYLIQNKNFESMFDRQIQTIEKSNDVTMMNSKFAAVSGTLTGTTTGAVAGGMKGGVYGAIAGAIVGGVASGVGGAVDVNNQAMLMQDNLDLQRAMHSYQIDNIKALPDTIQKVSALTVIDKVVPILEVFDCTQTEKEMFTNYIKYNGMSVGRIDTIENFESNGGFIQGRFIRLEGLSEDYHLANALNTTFQAGFYFDKEE